MVITDCNKNCGAQLTLSAADSQIQNVEKAHLTPVQQESLCNFLVPFISPFSVGFYCLCVHRCVLQRDPHWSLLRWLNMWFLECRDFKESLGFCTMDINSSSPCELSCWGISTLWTTVPLRLRKLLSKKNDPVCCILELFPYPTRAWLGLWDRVGKVN